MALIINGVTMPAPQTYSRAPVSKYVEYVSMTEHVQRDFTAGDPEWTYYIGWEALHGGEFNLVQTAWETMIATEGNETVTMTDLAGTTMNILPDGESNRFTYNFYSGRTSVDTSYSVLYDCTLIFRARQL